MPFLIRYAEFKNYYFYMAIPSTEDIIERESNYFLQCIVDHYHQSKISSKTDVSTLNMEILFDYGPANPALQPALKNLKDKGYIKTFKLNGVKKLQIVPEPFKFTEIQKFYYPIETNEEKNKSALMDRGIDEITCILKITYFNNKIKKLVESALDITEDKIKIFISKKDGVHRIINGETKSYPVRESRMEIIYELKDDFKSGKSLIYHYKDKYIGLNKSINQINKNIIKKLDTSQNFIINVPTGGYTLNTEYYETIFLD